MLLYDPNNRIGSDSGVPSGAPFNGGGRVTTPRRAALEKVISKTPALYQHFANIDAKSEKNLKDLEFYLDHAYNKKYQSDWQRDIRDGDVVKEDRLLGLAEDYFKEQQSRQRLQDGIANQASENIDTLDDYYKNELGWSDEKLAEMKAEQGLNSQDLINSEAGAENENPADLQPFQNRQAQAMQGQPQTRRSQLINMAKQRINQTKDKALNGAAEQAGSAIGDKNVFKKDSSETREKAKDLATQKAKKLAKDKIGKRITNEGIKKGFETGLEKGAKNVAKEGAKKAGKKIVEQGGKQLVKGGARVGAKAATPALEGVVAVGGAATGVETAGIGFLVAFLLEIAISLGVGDAVDGMFELGSGNIKKAFLFVRAATKVGMFLPWLLTMGFMVSIGGIIIGIPLLIILNIYMILGKIFKNSALLNGLVWWEIAVIIVMDIFLLIFTLTFILAMGWYLCTTTRLGAGGVQGALAGWVVTAYDWWNETSIGTVAAEFCKYVGPTGQ
jgi:hypothetical protein